MCLAESNSAGAMLKTGFWKAPRRQEQSMEDKYLLMYLLTSPQRACIGMYPLHVGEAAAQIGWDKQQFFTVLDRLAGQNEIIVNGYWVLVLNWWDHNSKPGPGLEATISRLLAEAPPLLKEDWLNVAQNAGVYPFDWKGQKATSQSDVGLDINTEKNCTMGTTLGTTPGKYNSNHKKNCNDNHYGKATPRSRVGRNDIKPFISDDTEAICGGDSLNEYCHIELPVNSEQDCRTAFERVCRKFELSFDEATQLGHELSARINAGNANSGTRINHIEPWLEAVVERSRDSGQQILRAGIEHANKIRNELARERSEKIRAENERNEADASLRRTAETETVIASIGENELHQIIDSTLLKLPPTSRKKYEFDIRKTLLQRKIPSGAGGAAVKSAVEQFVLNQKAGQ